MTDPVLAQAEGTQALKAAEIAVAVPSGQPVSLIEVIWNEQGPDGLTFRFRFLAPEIASEGGSVDYDTAAEDMLFLCQEFALPRVPNTGPQPAQIVISMSDRPVPFGATAPEATQFFEAFSIENGTCIWEIF